MKRAILASVLLVLGACPLQLLGCNQSAAQDASISNQPSLSQQIPASGQSSESSVIELFSWWARVGESDALGALMHEHQKRFPNDSMINATAELSGLARKTLRERLLRGEPPDSFQANIGYDMMQWVIVNGLDARESRLLPLDGELVNISEVRKAVPKTLIDLLSYDGHLYGVPSNVHRINSIFYNKRVFRDHGLKVPSRIEDLKVLGERLQRDRIPLFALGSREPWTLALFTFENLLVSREGPQFYEDFFHGKMQADDPRVVATLRNALELLDFANPDHARLSWLQALELVMRGQAAMTVMGDWARVSLNAHGMKLDEDYGELAFPGTEDVFVFTSDAFSLPRNSKNLAGAKRLLSTMASREGQKAMNDAKVALSARLDVVPSQEPILKQKHRLMTRGPLTLAFSGLVPAQFAEDMGQALAEMVAEKDPEPVVLSLRSRYALLR